jgi:hypothetical protein
MLCCAADVKVVDNQEVIANEPQEPEADPQPEEVVEVVEEPAPEDEQPPEEVLEEKPVDVFEYALEREDEGQKWGFDVDVWDVGLQILKIVDGRVSTLNAQEGAKQLLQVNDFIVAINGVNVTDGAKRDDIKTGKNIMLKVARPTQLMVTLKKDQGETRWGLAFSHQNDVSSCLKIKSVVEGAVQAYNKTEDDDAPKVLPGDFVSSACGVEGQAQLIKDQLAKEEVELGLLRLPVW